MTMLPASSATPLRILCIAPYAPSPIRVRLFQIVRHLALLGHRVTVAALQDDFVREDSLAELRALGVVLHIVPHDATRARLRSLAALPSRTPLWTAWSRSEPMNRLLRDLCAQNSYDVAHIEHLRAAHFADALPESLRIVWDAVDCLSGLQTRISAHGGFGLSARLLARIEAARLPRYEAALLLRFDRIAATTQIEVNDLRTLAEGHLSPIRAIPNGVDTNYFQPSAFETEGKADDETILFTGKLSYAPNTDAALWLADEILPALRRLRPRSALKIVGSRPPGKLLRRHDPEHGVEIIGEVDDLRLYFEAARVVMSPLRVAVGIQNKILEAFAMARPVVSTPLAARPFPTLIERGTLRVAKTAADFAEACASLLENPQQAREIGAQGREYVLQSHQWPDTARAFVRLYQEAMARS